MRNARAYIGGGTRNDAGRLMITSVRRGTPGIDAGLNVDDEIVAIDGVRVRAEGLTTRLEQYSPATGRGAGRASRSADADRCHAGRRSGPPLAARTASQRDRSAEIATSTALMEANKGRVPLSQISQSVAIGANFRAASSVYSRLCRVSSAPRWSLALAATLAWTPARATSERTAAATRAGPDCRPRRTRRSSSMASSKSGPGNRRRPIREFVQREPAEGLAPSYATEARIAYDGRPLCGAARLRHRTGRHRRDPDAPRSAVAVRLGEVIVDSYFDQPLRIRVRCQSGRREARSLLLQRRSERRQLGCGVGRPGRPRFRRLAGRVPHPVLAAALQQHRWGPGRVRARPRGRPPQRNRPGRCSRAMPTASCRSLPRCAAFASALAQAAELMPYTVGRSTPSPVEGNPLSTRRDPGALRRPRREVCASRPA